MNLFLPSDFPRAPAFFTWVGDGTSLAATVGTSRADGEKALGMGHLSCAMAVGALRPRRSRSGSRPFTARAAFSPRDLDLSFCPKCRIFKADSQIVSKICSGLSMGLPPSPSTRPKSKKILEYVTEAREDVFETPETGKARSLQPLMPVKVVEFSFLGVPQNLIGFGGLFEIVLGLPVTWVSVGVVLKGEFSVGLLDFILGRLTGDTQDLLVVSFGHELSF